MKNRMSTAKAAIARMYVVLSNKGWSEEEIQATLVATFGKTFTPVVFTTALRKKLTEIFAGKQGSNGEHRAVIVRRQDGELVAYSWDVYNMRVQQTKELRARQHALRSGVDFTGSETQLT